MLCRMNNLRRKKLVPNVRSINIFRVGRMNSRRQNMIYTVMVPKSGIWLDDLRVARSVWILDRSSFVEYRRKGFAKSKERKELLDLVSARVNCYCGCCSCRRARNIAADIECYRSGNRICVGSRSSGNCDTIIDRTATMSEKYPIQFCRYGAMTSVMSFSCDMA